MHGGVASADRHMPALPEFPEELSDRKPVASARKDVHVDANNRIRQGGCSHCEVGVLVARLCTSCV